MLKCFHCQNKIKGNGILISADGDFVCDEKCKKGYEREKEHFLNYIVHSEEKTEKWLLGK